MCLRELRELERSRSKQRVVCPFIFIMHIYSLFFSVFILIKSDRQVPFFVFLFLHFQKCGRIKQEKDHIARQ